MSDQTENPLNQVNEVLIFDTETTGLPDWQVPSEDPSQPHIVQLAAILVDVSTQEIKQSLDLIIKPEDWSISPELTEIHGITHEYADQVGVREIDAIDIFLDMLKDNVRVAHNTTFDNRIIRIAIKRYFGDELADAFKAKPYYCTMINAKKAMKVGKNPKLSEAYLHFIGKELVGAHRAMNDTLACKEIYFHLTGGTNGKTS